MILLKSSALFLLCGWLLLLSSRSQEINFEYDTEMLEAFLLPSSLSAYSQDFKDRVLSGNTETLQVLTDQAREYLKTIPLTNELLNGLTEVDNFNNYEIKRVVHWMYTFEILSEWSRDQSSQDLLEWVSYTDKYLEDFCDTFLITPCKTTEFEQELGANGTSCLKAVKPHSFVKYLRIRAEYVRILESGNLALDRTNLTTENLYRAAYNDFRIGKDRAMMGDRLVAMYRGLPIFAGHNCTSLGCAKSTTDEEICSSCGDSDHVLRNCTVSQEFIDYYTERDMNFVLSRTILYQDSPIAKLIYPSLMKDPSAYFFEYAQNSYYDICVAIVRNYLNPLKCRDYIDMDRVYDHEESVLSNWTQQDPNLTSWTDLDNPPVKGIDPSVDPVNAEAGDWIQYFGDLPSTSFSTPYFAVFVTFVRVRLFFGLFISEDVVRV